MRRLVSALSLLPLIAIAGCSSSGGEGTASTGGPAAGPTFHKDIEPLLQAHCQTCHAPGKIAPFSLMTYQDAAPVAGVMAEDTSKKIMPPWGAFDTDECKVRFGWKQDPRLSDAEIALIAAWSQAGAPEGDPKDAPPPVEPKADGLPGVEQTVKPVKPYVASGDKDIFRCFRMDPGFTSTMYLNGMHFIAGDPKVVHHALIFVDDKDESAALVDADGGYDCFGGSGISGDLLGAWAPGGVPTELPSNIATPIPAGSKLVMQIHYHPAGTTGQPDATQFQMRFLKSAPEYQAVISLIGNFPKENAKGDGLLPGPDDSGGTPEFRIPANKKGHTESMRVTIPGNIPDLKLYGAATHMHYVGTDMKIDLTRAAPNSGDPANECLLQTPQWNFNWQRFYAYDTDIEKLPSVVTGDVLNLRCTYDNTTDNPFVVKALMDQKLASPIDVKLGETTLDEMCLGGFMFIYKAP